jgi:hypothetical protein
MQQGRSALPLVKQCRLGDYFGKNVKINRYFDRGNFLELVFVDTYLASFIVVRQDLDGGVACPDPVMFESGRFLVLVKGKHRLGKKVLKKVIPSFFRAWQKADFVQVFPFAKTRFSSACRDFLKARASKGKSLKSLILSFR